MKYVIGNWKMNHKKSDVLNFLTQMKDFAPFKAPSWIAPQFIHLHLFKEYGPELGIETGGQNCSSFQSGAYTGEVSPGALKETGATFVLIGHSERRQYFGETDLLVNQKIKTALEAGLKVVFCLGETLEERKSDKTFEVIKAQLLNGLKDLSYSPNILIAYEPVWAIGTGLTASPAQAQEVHAFLRNEIKQVWTNAAQATPLLYGGSVKPDNFLELLNQKDIDGGLVGGASLKASDFAQLCKIASQFGA